MHWRRQHKSILVIMQTLIVTKAPRTRTGSRAGSGSGPVSLGLVLWYAVHGYSSWNMESTGIIYVQKIKYHKIISKPYWRVKWQFLKNALLLLF